MATPAFDDESKGERDSELAADVMEAEDIAYGSCSYYPADSTGCRAPRSCFHCLHRVLELEPDGCLLTEVGRCISALSNEGDSLDFREPNDNSSMPAATPAPLQFPASTTTYCEAKDDCDTCLSSSDSFCFGRDGCVCMAVCEAPDWELAVGGSECLKSDKTVWNGPMVITPFRSETQVEDNDDNSSEIFWCTVVILLATLAATMVMVIAIRRRGGKLRAEQHDSDDISVLEGPESTSSNSSKTVKPRDRQLNLFGWEAMCADLIAKERREMLSHGVFMAAPSSRGSDESDESSAVSMELPNASPSTHYLQLIGAQPSAPDMSPLGLESSAPRLSEL